MSDTPRTDAAYKEALDALGGDHSFALGQMRGYAEELERELTALRARLEASEKDAARYRWLRGQCGVRDRGYIGGQWLEFPDLVYDWNWLGKKTNEQIVEAAIDSAMGGRDAA